MEAYALLSGPTPSLGILLNYPETAQPGRQIITLAAPPPPQRRSGITPVLGVLGADNYAVAS